MLPAATALQKQGANKGATTAFLISTPESGVDSIAITYALLDPIMTVIRPVAALFSALSAGVLENFLHWREPSSKTENTKKNPPLFQQTGCCSTISETKTKSSNSVFTSVSNGIRYGVKDVWADIALWFYIGLVVAALITVIVPDEWISRVLGGGLGSMFVMLLVGVPLYICASASTPIAAALILKGVSPGAALVFLLVGPATNVTSLSVLLGVLGKKSTLRYLFVLSFCAVLFGLGVDFLYSVLDISPRAVIGEAAELVPESIKIGSAILLGLISIQPLARSLGSIVKRRRSNVTYHSSFPPIAGSGGKS